MSDLQDPREKNKPKVPKPPTYNPWEQEKGEGVKQALKAFSLLGSVGIYFVVFVGICLFLGSVVDDFFGWKYAGKLVGILIGFPGSIYSIYSQLKHGTFLS